MQKVYTRWLSIEEVTRYAHNSNRSLEEEIQYWYDNETAVVDFKNNRVVLIEDGHIKYEEGQSNDLI